MLPTSLLIKINSPPVVHDSPLQTSWCRQDVADQTQYHWDTGSGNLETENIHRLGQILGIFGKFFFSCDSKSYALPFQSQSVLFVYSQGLFESAKQPL